MSRITFPIALLLAMALALSPLALSAFGATDAPTASAADGDITWSVQPAPTAEGGRQAFEYKVDPGTQPGKILRLRGKGIKDLNGYGRGDQLIHLNVWTPKNVSSEERDLLEKLRESQNFVPHPGKNEKGFFEKVKEYFQ